MALRDAVARAIAELRSVHSLGADCGPKGGCEMCWPKDGYWPCETALIATELEQAMKRHP